MSSVGKSNYSVRALSYCDLHKIMIRDLREILDIYPEFACDFLQNFRVTFNLRHGDLVQQEVSRQVDEETLKFIRQKRPRLQCKGHGSRTLGLKRKLNLKRPVESAGVSSDEEISTRVELSPQKSSSIIVAAEKKPLRKVPLSVSGRSSSRPHVSSSGVRPKHSNHISPSSSSSASAIGGSQAAAAQPSGLSPIPSVSSSTSCLPKSSSSTGPLHSPPGQLHPSHGHTHGHGGHGQAVVQCQYRGHIHTLTDIDERLEAINQRMSCFEANLCTTVDSILELLGHKPRVVREHYEAQSLFRPPCRPQRIDLPPPPPPPHPQTMSLSHPPFAKAPSATASSKLPSSHSGDLERVLSQV